MHKILVVDDEAVIASALQERLTKMGYEVVGWASSGEAAIEMAERRRPELIFMDIVMPGKMDGIEAAQIIKKELDIPVIFITGHLDDQYIERAKGADPYGYLVKPIDTRKIKPVVEMALYRKDMERRLQKLHDELEQKVGERTAELSVANDQLREEVCDRKKAEEILKKREKDLEGKRIRLEELNAALKILLEKRMRTGKSLKRK